MVKKQEEPFIPCFRCGVCCIKYQVRLNLVEARRLADRLGLAWDEFRARYVDRHWPATESFLLRQEDGACVFLERGGGLAVSSCLIHPFKPLACQELTCSLSRPECQEGLARDWGLTISPAGRIRGPKETIQRFRSFLNSLTAESAGDTSVRLLQ